MNAATLKKRAAAQVSPYYFRPPEQLTYAIEIPVKTKILNFFRRFFIFTGFDKVLANLTQNQPASSLLVKMIPPNYLYPPGTRRLNNYKGIHFETDISDSMGHFVYYGIADPAQCRLFSLAKQGMTILDVGTNIGFTAFNFGRIAGNSGRVYGFEPDAYNFKQAAANLGRNNLSTVSLHNIGLGDKPGTASLFNVNEKNRGMLRILRDDKTHGPMNRSEIALTTLDTFFAEHQLASIDLIKIDVEGYELKVLQGAHKMLIKYQPLLFIEVDDRNLREQGSTPLELIGYLQILGYMICNAVNKEQITQLTNLDRCHIDIIATPKCK